MDSSITFADKTRPVPPPAKNGGGGGGGGDGRERGGETPGEATMGRRNLFDKK